MEKVKLYSYFRSSCSYRVRIALNLKGIPYIIVPIHLLKNGGEQNTNTYKKLNPSGQVPALVDNDVLIGQSMAILEYLEETFQGPRLLPDKPSDRAVVRQMCEIINSGMQPLQNLSVSQYFTDTLQLENQEKQMWFEFWLKKGFQSLETLLDKHAKTYCFGDQLSLADCLLVPQVYNAKRFKIDMKPFEKVMEINDRCLTLTDFIKASPEKQPDFEP